MHDRGFKRWVVWGALASASLLFTACESAQQPGNSFEVEPGSFKRPAEASYNGTIQDIHSSIDPRTPEAQGTPGRSLLMDEGERALLEAEENLRLEAIAGGKENQGSVYGGSGTEGAAPIPTERDLIVVPDQPRQEGSSTGHSGKGTDPQ